MARLMTASLALALVAAGAGWAQEGFVACSSQQAIEQYIQSQGELVPDGCRTISTALIETDGMRLCAVDIGGADGGLVGTVADAALPTQWWADCEAIARELP